MSLSTTFEQLEAKLDQLIALLEESDDGFWIAYLKRGKKQVAQHHLAGATFILGCYGGADTFSDLVIGEQWQAEDPLRYRNANARLGELRTQVFELASSVASRRHW